MYQLWLHNVAGFKQQMKGFPKMMLIYSKWTHLENYDNALMKQLFAWL